MAADSKADASLRVFLDYRERLESSVFRIVGCRATAADLVQDLFLRLWRRSIERPDDSAGYLFRSARNLAVDHLRSARVRARHSAQINYMSHFFIPPSEPVVLPTSQEPLGTVKEKDEGQVLGKMRHAMVH